MSQIGNEIKLLLKYKSVLDETNFMISKKMTERMISMSFGEWSDDAEKMYQQDIENLENVSKDILDKISSL